MWNWWHPSFFTTTKTFSKQSEQPYKTSSWTKTDGFGLTHGSKVQDTKKLEKPNILKLNVLELIENKTLIEIHVSNSMQKNNDNNEDNQNDTFEDIREAQDSEQDSSSQSELAYSKDHFTQTKDENEEIFEKI